MERDINETDDAVLEDSERQPCEVWTRVMGYFRQTSLYNIGKKQEFKDRKWMKESIAMEQVKRRREMGD
jgi:hypothetical protein